ncbi:2-amino-4-hydroxy-6-hydroxymethyldihydropteridine pyrophosphokinase [bioreactor metagenome]|uniref:2-amino-4-hydroxy-6-hydroxymethyldihydropteridine diphosphokinase n=1 Tax=bioreactor metagenome TaxID=1076179 RepID=A0A644T8Q1_9ZZZZ|nr:2-amino-4-hydroxy-6-hydroxymethyldihydropteridine diphosphokinase [Negativicutes bacterium]
MIVLGLGSNIGDREVNISTAIKMLKETNRITVLKTSALYRSEPVGVKEQPEFLNAVLCIETSLTPYELLTVCNDVEHRMGRIRARKWGPRNIDIDILMYNDVVLNSAALNLPHPRLHERNFVLVPLLDVMGSLPIYKGLNTEELIKANNDTSKVHYFKELIVT